MSIAKVDNQMRIGGTAVLRNPELAPLEDAQIKRFAPTVFAKRPIEGVSDNYGFVNTFEVIKAMRDSGFECVEVRQSQRRGEDAEAKMPYTKHLMKFRQTGAVKKLMKAGDSVPQIVVLNSHDRSSGFHMYGGLFRMVCSNGLIVATSDLVEPIKVRHSVNMVRDILDKARILAKGADGVFTLRENMLNTRMTEKQAMAFARSAIDFRPPGRSGLMLPEHVLTARRREDDKLDLWHVFNRVQENMIGGGIATTTENNRAAKTKGIGRIERDVEVNSKLWGLAVKTLEKQGKIPAVRRAKAAVDELLA